MHSLSDKCLTQNDLKLTPAQLSLVAAKFRGVWVGFIFLISVVY